MKFLLLLLLVTHTALCQPLQKAELVGLWQRGTAEVAAGYVECYRFQSNGRFVFSTSQYDGLSVIDIRGRYTLTKSGVFLVPDSITERQGGTPVLDEVQGGNGWVVEGATIRRRPLPRRRKHVLALDTCGQQCIQLRGQKYYKIE